MEEKKTYAVLIIDNFHLEPEYDYVVDGFPTLELAIEYARRVVRASVEYCRQPDLSKEEIRKMWYQFGEDATVLGGDYAGGDELDFFIDHPATPEECDWEAIKKKAGIQ